VGGASRLRAITGEGDAVYAVGDAGAIFRSRDGGLRWEPLQSGLGAADLRAVWAGGGEVCAAGDAGTLICSGDGGETWRADPALHERGDDLTGVFGLPEGDRFVSSRGGLVLHKTAALEWHSDGGARERVNCVEIETPHQTVSVRGGLTEEEVTAVVKRAEPGARFCFDSSLSQNPERWGGVTVHFRVNAAGEVTAARPEGGRLGSDVDGCIAKKISQLSFPEVKNGRSTRVSYPFFFVPYGPVCERRALPLYGLTGAASGRVYAVGERGYLSEGERGRPVCRGLCSEFTFRGGLLPGEQIVITGGFGELEERRATPLSGVGALYGAAEVSYGGALAAGVYAVGARGAIVYNSGPSPFWMRVPSGTGADLYGVTASPWGTLYVVGAEGTLLMLGEAAPSGGWW
jgi:hypothetical protein